MVSIIPRVDLFGNTVVDWICKLSYFRLDTLYYICHTFIIAYSLCNNVALTFLSTIVEPTTLSSFSGQYGPPTMERDLD